MSETMVDECGACVALGQRVAGAREDAVCEACGSLLVWRGSLPDARVRVADEARLRPSKAPPEARRTVVEDADTVRVRRLLTELRPDRNGPLGWAADGAPSVGGGSNWTPAMRVQTSVEVPAILPGAFAGRAAQGAGAAVAERIARHDADVAAVLHWAQRNGTLAKGLRAFYAAAGEAVAPPVTRDAWKALAPALRVAAAPGYGKRRVDAAMAAWWGEERVSTVAPAPTESALAASAETGAALDALRARVG